MWVFFIHETFCHRGCDLLLQITHKARSRGADKTEEKAVLSKFSGGRSNQPSWCSPAGEIWLLRRSSRVLLKGETLLFRFSTKDVSLVWRMCDRSAGKSPGCRCGDSQLLLRSWSFLTVQGRGRRDGATTRTSVPRTPVPKIARGWFENETIIVEMEEKQSVACWRLVWGQVLLRLNFCFLLSFVSVDTFICGRVRWIALYVRKSTRSFEVQNTNRKLDQDQKLWMRMQIYSGVSN